MVFGERVPGGERQLFRLTQILHRRNILPGNSNQGDPLKGSIGFLPFDERIFDRHGMGVGLDLHQEFKIDIFLADLGNHRLTQVIGSQFFGSGITAVDDGSRGKLDRVRSELIWGFAPVTNVKWIMKGY